MANHKNGSDVDLAIKGKDITETTIYKLLDLLNEEYPLPYFFDLIHYDNISNEKWREHIDEEGKIIFKQHNAPSVRSSLEPRTYPMLLVWIGF
ncbi:nucleotidyltransferase domain-containing protein [Radiobacillus kanasensis]|nr:nucleotidyltransferase domain-containing protein [Radiobacillus kanasensis]